VKQEVASNRSLASHPGRFGGNRRARATLAAGLGLVLALLLSAAVAAARPADPGSTGHGYIIVQLGDRDLVARAITFTTPISGLRALELSGLNVVTATFGWGSAVCSIEGVGCPATNCFCGGTSFWNYNYWDGNAWQGYLVGADTSALNDGAVEGWRWGAWGSAMWPARPVTAALQALDWLRPLQSLTDGGYGSESGSAEASLAIGANHYPAAVWRRQPDSPSLANYWLGRASSYSQVGAAEAGKLAVGAASTDICWPHNALTSSAYYSPTTGAYGFGAGRQAWAILGTLALSETVPAQATQHLKSLVQLNGGWAWQPGFGADTNTTALALQALIATGEPLASTLVTQGLAYLKSAQNADGGFTYDPDSLVSTASDANSTAYVLQALLAAGQDPTAVAWSVGQNNPVSFLLSLQLPDGSFEWQKGLGERLLATRQVVVSLLGRIFPLRVAQITACPTIYLPLVNRP
jgi:hypothetical protein